MTSKVEPMPDHQPILVIQDDDCLGPAIVEQLRADDYPAKLARSANHATVLAKHEPPALVILGELDTTTGALSLLRAIRSSGPDAPWHPDVPIIMVSSECEQTDLLRAFDAGADDFIESPPTYLELRARLRAILRRTRSPTGRSVLQVGPLRIDTAAHAATLHGTCLALRQMEYDLLVHLASEPTRVFRKSEILRTVWDYPEPGRTRTLHSHASRLRSKLNAVGGRWVINVHGVGYRLI
jgi:DNA-binding response OmpR family regulator